MKILVTGAGGQLGYDVCKELARLGIEHRGVDIADFDITNEGAVSAYITEYHPDAVIHCSAFTAVDRAEDEPEKCRAVNVDGTQNIASTCKTIGAKMMYISTDYVFAGVGESFHKSNDEPAPTSVYGKTKLGGEFAVKELLDNYFIVRISWVFGENGSNFVKTMLRLAETRDTIGVVCDQIGSPTYTADLAPLLCAMIQSDKYGTYHATNEGICSWADFAEAIFEYAGKPVIVNRILTKDYPTKAVRPHNSRLCKARLDEQGFARLPSWQDALKRYISVLTTDNKEDVV